MEVRKQVEIENDNIKKENEVLTDLLFNQSRMYEFAAIHKSSRSNYLSRSEQQMTLGTIPLSMPSGFTTQNLERAFSKLYPEMSGLGASFVLAEELYGVNCIVLVSIAILESGGGFQIAKIKNNLCGLAHMMVLHTKVQKSSILMQIVYCFLPSFWQPSMRQVVSAMGAVLI